MAAKPLLYGADWCKKTIAIQEYFKQHEVAYEYINVEQSEEAMQAIQDMNRGKVRFPMVVVGATAPMKNPSPEELDKALAAQA